MEAKFQIFLILLAVLAGTALLARRINIAPAILLLLAGIALAFVPGMPTVELPPELVLLVVLPPLIYSASVAMSWREFKSNLRPIVLLSVGCVIFTAFAVATATHYLIGLPWSVGFLLGAIVAPPDVVAPLAIARKLGMPRRILVVLEGEGLANDATALILYRFTVAAISTGHVLAAEGDRHLRGDRRRRDPVRRWRSAGSPCAPRHRARDPQVEITLSLITPYLAYWIPEHLGGSGVIATVACGLYISWNGPLLISSATRLQGIFFWDLVIYLIEGLLFLLTGFQMRLLFEKSKAFPLRGDPARDRAGRGRSSSSRASPGSIPRPICRGCSASGCASAIRRRPGARLSWSPSPACAARCRWLRRWRCRFALPSGEAFPYRDLILFVAFGVILITLVGTGARAAAGGALARRHQGRPQRAYGGA